MTVQATALACLEPLESLGYPCHPMSLCPPGSSARSSTRAPAARRRRVGRRAAGGGRLSYDVAVADALALAGTLEPAATQSLGLTPGFQA